MTLARSPSVVSSTKLAPVHGAVGNWVAGSSSPASSTTLQDTIAALCFRFATKFEVFKDHYQTLRDHRISQWTEKRAAMSREENTRLTSWHASLLERCTWTTLMWNLSKAQLTFLRCEPLPRGLEHKIIAFIITGG